MRSQEQAAVLLDYCAGKLGRETARGVERHMTECTACAEFVSAQSALWLAMESWAAPEVSADFDRRLYRSLDEAKSGPRMESLRAAFRRGWMRPALAMAAFFIVIGAGLLLQIPHGNMTTPRDPQARVDKVEAEQVESELDDMQMLRELAVSPKTEGAPSKTL